MWNLNLRSLHKVNLRAIVTISPRTILSAQILTTIDIYVRVCLITIKHLNSTISCSRIIIVIENSVSLEIFTWVCTCCKTLICIGKHCPSLTFYRKRECPLVISTLCTSPSLLFNITLRSYLRSQLLAIAIGSNVTHLVGTNTDVILLTTLRSRNPLSESCHCDHAQ